MLDPQVGAVDLLADAGQARRQQQRDPSGRDQVPVALQHLVVAQEVDRQREQQQPEHEPVRLVAGECVVDAVDDDQPEGGEQRHQREQVGIGVGQAHPQVEVGGEADRQEVAAVDRLRLPSWLLPSWMKTAVKPAVSSSATGISAISSRLRAPLTGGRAPCVRSRSSISETASPRERSLCPVTESRRCRAPSWSGSGSRSAPDRG